MGFFSFFKKIFSDEGSSSEGLSVKRVEHNPILVPRDHIPWESGQTFNPAAVLLNGVVHFVYRAIGSDGASRFGYANSRDAETIDERLPYPAYEHSLERGAFKFVTSLSGGSWGGCEDPRIVRVGDERRIYMTYTACDGGLRVGLTSIGLDDFLAKRWRWKRPALVSAPGEVHKNWVIFPEKINGKYAILHSLNPDVAIEYRDSLDFEDGEIIESGYGGGEDRENCWDNWVRGAGPPPVKTEKGWLVFYHAMDHDDPGRYKVGVMLLDLGDPTKVLHRGQEPVLEPNENYENEGFKAGVVYASGVVVKDGILYLYYGAADSYVCVASSPLNTFLDSLIETRRPKLSPKSGFSLLRLLGGRAS